MLLTVPNIYRKNTQALVLLKQIAQRIMSLMFIVGSLKGSSLQSISTAIEANNEYIIHFLVQKSNMAYPLS